MCGILSLCAYACVCVCTYGAVEDHEALVEVVVLHGGVAVELGQWVVAPGHTHTHTLRKLERNTRFSPTRVYATVIHALLGDSCSCAAPLYVGVVDSSVVQVVAQSRYHQSQDLDVAEVILPERRINRG